ncbi:type II toxin-antitoxin system VapC family toxin [Thermodesulfatator atlanticus]|uniref:type II toxin-antitoxin system VapC family toxin n=1 Tax=Thermodesulfatator atlanticus TaxID=501497 RepID=UPI0003B77020|nr:PIN domain-containing protein [Thermodesulfatator atlanticus]
MRSDIKSFYGRKILVDSNAFIYFLTGQSPLIKEIFRASVDRKLKLLITVRILDEVIFKMCLLLARARFGFEKNTLKKLKNNPSLIIELSKDCRKIIEMCEDFRFSIFDFTFKDLQKLPDTMHDYRLIGNDALIVGFMQKMNLKYLLSADKDFDAVPWIKRIDPLDKEVVL